MRLWSLHPRHLDARGLVALWREGLLARAVLRGRTRGYRFHPQLDRFRARPDPVRAVECYLSRVLEEARARGYRFDGTLFPFRRCRGGFPVTRGQVERERVLLARKLLARTGRRLRGPVAPHPCLVVVPGPPEPWERSKG